MMAKKMRIQSQSYSKGAFRSYGGQASTKETRGDTLNIYTKARASCLGGEAFLPV